MALIVEPHFTVYRHTVEAVGQRKAVALAMNVQVREVVFASLERI